MADTPAPSQPSKSKRRLRAPAETVREKALKAQTIAENPVQPTKRRRAFNIFKLPFRGLAWVGHRPPLKQIGHGFRWFSRKRAVRFLGRILGFRYVYHSWQELKLVAWPSRAQSFRLTGAVIVFSVVFGALIAVVDFGLDKLFKQVILK